MLADRAYKSVETSSTSTALGLGPRGGEFTVDLDPAAQKSPGVAYSAVRDCLIVEEDNAGPGGDFDIQGRLAHSYPTVYLPLVVR